MPSRTGRPVSAFRRWRALTAAALLAAFLPVAVARAGEHDATSHHDFADVPQWQKVFDDPGRDAWQKPEQIIGALGIRSGHTVADVGAGTGYFSKRLSAAVGETGTVLAADTELNLVAHLRARAEQEKTPNVVPILASTDNPRLPARGSDVILFVDTIHHVDDRITYLRGLRRFLRAGGRIAVVDWQKRDTPVGPPLDHRLPREQVVDEFKEAGYRLVASPDVVPYQYVLLFVPADERPPLALP